MKNVYIAGLQKMTLLDYPHHVACTVFFNGCNFRCPFCHNYELTGHTMPEISVDVVYDFFKKRKGILDGIAITGGEPCMYEKLPEFMKIIKDMGYLVKLDTNGSNPKMLKEILNEGLADYVAMDIKNSPENYAQTAGLQVVDMNKIRQSIQIIMDHAEAYEFRTTVIKEYHDIKSFDGIGGLISNADLYVLQRFEDRDTVPKKGLHAPSEQEMHKFSDTISKYVKKVIIRGM